MGINRSIEKVLRLETGLPWKVRGSRYVSDPGYFYFVLELELENGAKIVAMTDSDWGYGCFYNIRFEHYSCTKGKKESAKWIQFLFRSLNKKMEW